MPTRRPMSILFLLLAVVLALCAAMRAAGWLTHGNPTVLADLAFLSFVGSFLAVAP